MNFKTGELSDTEYRYLKSKSKAFNERQEVRFFKENPDAKRAELEFLPEKPEVSREWVRLVWYGEACGGKLVRFRAGSPYLPKNKHTEDELYAEMFSESEREAKRLGNSLSRTRRRIFEIAACNPWQWFWTGTLDGQMCDRNDLNGTFKRLSQFLRDWRKKHDGERLTYLIVPEQHKDGAWHFHGLFNGLPVEGLHKFTLDEILPCRIRRTIESGTDVYEWRDYSSRFGYTTLTAVRSHEAVSKYVTKYITKSMVETAIGSGRHLYYASQGLIKPEILAEGHILGRLPDVDYMGEWVGIRNIATAEEMNACGEMYFNKRVLSDLLDRKDN
ncbi:MAG: hypothetical protein ACI4MH_00755 [Candidatus Coproplasma sp.]